MRLKDVFPDDDISLLEASLRDKLSRLAAAGAIGAGILGGGYGLHKLANQPPPTSSRIEKTLNIPYTAEPDEPWVQKPYVEPDDADISTDSPRRTRPDKTSISGEPHDAFPTALLNQLDAPRKQKIINFKKTFIPVIHEINLEIAHDRQQISKILDPKHKISDADKTLLKTLASRYNVPLQKDAQTNKTIQELAKDLLLKVDIVPEQLVLAQAALESGWGTSELARQANNFFGLKSSEKHEPHEIIRHMDNINYRYYNSLHHGIKSHIHNLNTHRAYRDFRQASCQLKKQKNMNSELMSRELTKHLKAYSASPIYGQKLRDMIQTLKSAKI